MIHGDIQPRKFCRLLLRCSCMISRLTTTINVYNPRVEMKTKLEGVLEGVIIGGVVVLGDFSYSPFDVGRGYEQRMSCRQDTYYNEIGARRLGT
jgi:hypothetical protein